MFEGDMGGITSEDPALAGAPSAKASGTTTTEDTAAERITRRAAMTNTPTLVSDPPIVGLAAHRAIAQEH
jgi:hypothetical protein